MILLTSKNVNLILHNRAECKTCYETMWNSLNMATVEVGGVSDVVEKVENDEGWWREWRGGWLLWKLWSCMGCFIFTWESLMKYGCVDEIASRIKTTWENPVCKVSPHDCGLAGTIMVPDGDLIHEYNFIEKPKTSIEGILVGITIHDQLFCLI